MTEMDKPLPTPFARARLIYTHKRFGFNRRKKNFVVAPHEQRRYISNSLLKYAYGGSHIVCWVPALFVSVRS